MGINKFGKAFVGRIKLAEVRIKREPRLQKNHT